MKIHQGRIQGRSKVAPGPLEKLTHIYPLFSFAKPFQVRPLQQGRPPDLPLDTDAPHDAPSMQQYCDYKAVYLSFVLAIM